ncbi:MAG: lipoate--protein ligase family protein [Planctomycetia bacterium]|nr:lipoate--protein ligase family protein [Planctomycetia bacterium]
MRQRHGSGDIVWLDAEPDTVEGQLALDEALLEEAHEGIASETVVRTWMARETVVVVGSSSRIEEEVDLEACSRAGVRVVRRPSGGLTVVLGPGCLTWSVVEPHPAGTPPLDRIHSRMLDPLCAALTRATAGRGPVTRRGTSDLVIPGPESDLKVSGNALRVRRHGVLYHGTLLDDFDIGLIERILLHPPREPDYRAGRTHGTFLANLRLGHDALSAAVREAFAPACCRSDWPRDRVARLVTERYANPDWTRRL